MQEPRPRRALHELAPPDRRGGEEAEAQVLERALEQAARGPDDSLTHGFHAYPARMHPGIARTVLQAWARPEGRLLDPFCGSGTVLVEGMCVHARATGVDLNPIALRLTEVKCALRDAECRARFLERLEQVVAASKQRVRARTRVRAPLGPDERKWYEPHVLAELGGLHAEIATVKPKSDRRALEMVLSAIVVKFSRQRAETSTEQVEKRIGKGIVTGFFDRKARELVERWEALFERCEGALPPLLREGDATRLGELLPPRHRFELVLSSPPYGGTYDYARQHARRWPWLGIEPRRLKQREIGARRNLSGRDRNEAVRAWDHEVEAMLRSIAGVLTPDGLCVLLIGDGDVGGRRIQADTQLRRLAPATGLELTAWASAPRLDRRGDQSRHEHLLLLRPRSA
jgi:16S rRNA G966 N2-methylase RsmD